MGFFDKILKGLGFEDEEVPIQKEPKIKTKKEKKQKRVTATYNLNNLVDDNLEQKNQVKEVKQTENSSSDFEVVKVTNQEQVQMVINKLKLGSKILLNIENLNSADITRSLDFITGAIFALNLKMQKIDEKIFLIQ